MAPLSSATGTIAVDVALLGGATGWTAAITSDPATFLSGTLSGMSGGAGTGVLTIDYGQNTGGVREGVVTLTPTGGGAPVALTITQLGLAPSLAVSAPSGSDFMTLSSVGGTIVANVALTGGPTDWTVVSSEDFITFGSKTSTTQVINYAANTDLARTGQVTFTSTGGGVAPVSQAVDIRQLGAASTIRLMTTFAPGYTMVPADRR